MLNKLGKWNLVSKNDRSFVSKDRFELSTAARWISLDETGKSIFRVQSKNRIIASDRISQEKPKLPKLTFF